MSAPHTTDADAVRRASGRVRKQPETYGTSSPSGSAKRKRSNRDDVQVRSDHESEEEQPLTEGESDEEEIAEKSSAPKRRAPKKTKVNSTSLPIRNGSGGSRKRATKKAKATVDPADAGQAGGLYAKVFASGENLEKIAAAWLRSFNASESLALAEVVNFILKCAGCNSTVEDHDIEDIDGTTNRLTDIQEEYQATAPTDYPLIAKGRAGQAFKETLSGFLDALIKSTAASGVLYDTPLLENTEAWFSTMSSAGNRAFRHTATVASVSLMTSLAEVAAERQKEAAATQLQRETERKKATVNRGRVKQLEQKISQATQALDFIQLQLKDWFDTVFIHRYRDVDPAIRRDCMTALGDWLITLPDFFFDGQHLRYLGWVLSDTNPATRGEVVKQLQRLYEDKDKIGGLKTFTERFRARLVEIATTDAESNVRASGIELLDILRENGLLEPDDVDLVGRLVYDSDIRIRKAVANFFAENVNDLYNSKVDDLGGFESLEEALPEIGEDNFETPRLEWLKFKSLAEMLVAYDTDDSLQSQTGRTRGDEEVALHAAPTESRFTLAADVLYRKIEEIKDWQVLSGYLLFDHSAGRANGVANDSLSQLKHECVLLEKEETILLEVVTASIKHTITDIAEKCSSAKSKLSKIQKQELIEEQEEAARHVTGLIPKLLKKFGDVPSTAAAVLRMENVLNLPSLQDSRQDSVTYSVLLDDIKKQFMAHGTDEVLGPASEAISHAKSYGELDDVTDEKLAGLWEDVINNLAELIDPKTIAMRGVSEMEELVALSNNLLRITRLAQVAKCTSALEDSSIAKANGASGANYEGAIDYIIGLIQRASPTSGLALEPEKSTLEDEIAARSAEAALRYLQWKIYSIIRATTLSTFKEIPYAELEALATRRDQYVTNLQSVLEARKAGDSVCILMATYMLELHTSAVVLKTIRVKPGVRDDWDVLIMDLQPTYLKSIMKVFAATEKNFARLGKKKLAIPALFIEAEQELDAEPMDEDPESDSEPESDDEPTQIQASQQRKETQQRNAVLAEEALCVLTGKIIWAVHANVVGDGSVRRRLEWNKARLGHNFKETLAYLDIGVKNNSKAKAKGTAKSKLDANGVVGSAAKLKAHPKGNAIVAEDEMEDEIEDGEIEGDKAMDGVEAGGVEVESVLSD